MQCYSCQAVIDDDARFCPHCGQPLPQHARQHEAVLSGEVDVKEITELREEKRRVTGELKEMMDRASRRDLTEHERRVWTALRERWEEVSSQITARMEYVSARRELDRRIGDRRTSDRRIVFPAIRIPDRRASEGRRKTERRQGADRRDPPTPS
jgi:DNA repair exonuclease SbcCD ATPase subunit